MTGSSSALTFRGTTAAAARATAPRPSPSSSRTKPLSSGSGPATAPWSSGCRSRSDKGTKPRYGGCRSARTPRGRPRARRRSAVRRCGSTSSTRSSRCGARTPRARSPSPSSRAAWRSSAMRAAPASVPYVSLLLPCAPSQQEHQSNGQQHSETLLCPFPGCFPGPCRPRSLRPRRPQPRGAMPGGHGHDDVKLPRLVLGV